MYIMTISAAALGWPGKWNGICLSLIFLPSHSQFLSLVHSLHSFNNRPIIHNHFFPLPLKAMTLKESGAGAKTLAWPAWQGATHTDTLWPITTGNSGPTISVCPFEKRIMYAVFKHRWRGNRKMVRIRDSLIYRQPILHNCTRIYNHRYIGCIRKKKLINYFREGTELYNVFWIILALLSAL